LTAHAWRSFAQENEELNYKMGQNKNWAIGFFDMQGSGGFSSTMELNLWDGVTEIENLNDEPLASVVKVHEFNAINEDS
jgi:hypothetical protein